MTGLDFLKLPSASTDHDLNFHQVYIDFLTGRVWLVPTFKRATATQAAYLFCGSVFRDVGRGTFSSLNGVLSSLNLRKSFAKKIIFIFFNIQAPQYDHEYCVIQYLKLE